MSRRIDHDIGQARASLRKEQARLEYLNGKELESCNARCGQLARELRKLRRDKTILNSML